LFFRQQLLRDYLADETNVASADWTSTWTVKTAERPTALQLFQRHPETNAQSFRNVSPIHSSFNFSSSEPSTSGPFRTKKNSNKQWRCSSKHYL